MIDVDHQINAVRRTVGDRTLEAGEARVVTISQSYATDAADLWDACTNIDRIPRWFLPITGDLRVGGHYALEGNANGTILPATHRASSPRPGNAATTSAGSRCGSPMQDRTGHASNCNTFRTSTTTGSSSGPAPSGWDTTAPWSA